MKYSSTLITRRLPLILICILITQFSFSRITPIKGARLNYTQIFFEYDEVPGADNYTITISSNDNSNKPVIVNNRSLACIVSGFDFGKSYNWKYEAFKKGQPVFKSEDFSFTIVPHYLADTNLLHSNIEIAKQGAFNNDIIFLDYRGIAIDRTGKPVWYYRFNSADGQVDPKFRNLRMTKQGTVTMLNDSLCYEVDLRGNAIWTSPNEGKISGDPKEHYHHDFLKLDNGTYLTCSYKYYQEPNFYDPSVNCQVRYNTLIQYDSTGKIIWSWNEKDHVSREIIFGVYKASDTIIAGTHMNAIDYDEKEDAIVMSCRHNSSVVKIDRKTGDVIYMLGVYDKRKEEQGLTPMFLHQHGMQILPDHRLMLYDNNAHDTKQPEPTYPRIIILKEPQGGLPAYVDWEFDCRSDRYPDGIMGKGGYAQLLPNGNILVCMGGPNYIFEVTPDKEVVWQCSFQKLENGAWGDVDFYRAVSSSSLYPYRFSIQNEVTNKSSVRFALNNEGTDNDSYEISAVSPANEKLFSKTVSVNARNSQAVEIPLKKKWAKKEFKLVVSSLSNRTDKKLVVL